MPQAISGRLAAGGAPLRNLFKAHHRLVLLGLHVEPVAVVQADWLLPETLVDRFLFLEDDEAEVRNPLAGGSDLRLRHALGADANLSHLERPRETLSKVGR